MRKLNDIFVGVLYLAQIGILVSLYFDMKKNSGGTANGAGTPGYGVDGRNPIPVPRWVYISGALSSAVGTAAWVLAPTRETAATDIPLALMLGGIMLIVAARIIYGDAVVRRNAVRLVIAGISYLLVMGGVLVGGLALYGVFNPPEARTWLECGIAGVILGIPGLYYGIKYHQDRESVAIGRELGFTDADSGPTSPDGAYDSKGVMNGMEVLFNIEPSSGREPSSFLLEVLCRCANPSGVLLELRPVSSAHLTLNPFSLPKLPSVPLWEDYEIRSNMPELVLKPLSEARHEHDVFTAAAGFSGMSLDKEGFKFKFYIDGFVETADSAFIRKILEETSGLAAAFN